MKIYPKQQNMIKRLYKGQAVIESVVSIGFLSILIAGTFLLLADCGSFIYYKMKVAQAAESAARYVTESDSWLGTVKPYVQVNEDATLVANDVLSYMNLPSGVSGGVTVTVPVSNPNDAQSIQYSYGSADGNKFITVTVSVAKLKLWGIPFPVTISETSSSAYANTLPVATFAFQYYSNNGYSNTQLTSVVVPCYGIDNKPATSGGTDYNYVTANEVALPAPFSNPSWNANVGAVNYLEADGVVSLNYPNNNGGYNMNSPPSASNVRPWLNWDYFSNPPPQYFSGYGSYY